jgi:endonuclease/exonuclease/phosphatase (EEP) superfamily protein YafD
MAIACAGPTSTVIPAKDDAMPARIRIVTYNVNFGLAGDPDGIAAIASIDPDVVFLQETNEVWSAALIAGLRGLPEFRFTPPQGAWLAGGMGVMSRWPILRVDELPSPGGPFFAWRVVVDAPGGAFQALNFHLRPPMSDGGSWVVGYFSTREVREREAAVHAEALEPDLPAVVVGDFNEGSDGRAVAVFLRRGFDHALARFAPKTRTWEWPVGVFTLRFQLDHILSRGFVAAAAGVVEAGRSDHRPVWADLERTGRGVTTPR